MAEQKLFWISKKSTFGTGKDALGYGDEVGDKIPSERIPKHKAAGEIGTIETATPEGIKVDEALKKVSNQLASTQGKLKAANKKVDDLLEIGGDEELTEKVNTLESEKQALESKIIAMDNADLEKLVDYQVIAEETIALLSKDKLKKEDKEKLISELEALK